MFAMHEGWDRGCHVDLPARTSDSPSDGRRAGIIAPWGSTIHRRLVPSAIDSLINNCT